MKKLLSILFLAGFGTLLINSTGNRESPTFSEPHKPMNGIQTARVDAEPAVKKYQIKSGIVTFETLMAGKKGKEILYFDNYGMKELVEKYTGENISEATLADGTTLYKIKYDQKAAYKMGNASRGVAYKFDWNELPEADRGTKAKKLPAITVAGKECESYSHTTSGMTTTYAGWKNICLFTEQKMKFGTSLTKAVKLEENVAISPEKFRIPAGFEVK